MIRQVDTTMRDALRARLISEVESHGHENAGKAQIHIAAWSRLRHPQDRPAVWATTMTAVSVVVIAALAISFTPPRLSGGHSATAPTAHGVGDAHASLLKALPSNSGEQPALTWTDSSETPAGAPVLLDGKSAVVAGACNGGGEIVIKISGLPDTRLDCSSLDTIGPKMVLDPRRPSTSTKGISVGVSVAKGEPRYVVRLSTLTMGTSSSTP